MSYLAHYLFFKDNCKEAMEFYQSVFGGKLDVMYVKNSPVASNMGADMQDLVLHSYLESGKIVLMASDYLDTGSSLQKGNNVEVCLVCDSKEEIETMFNKLSEGGKIVMPLKDEFFGMFGSFVDKFDIPWMVQFDNGKNNG